MYAVIFKAIIKDLEEEYTQVASRMRELALGKYGCTKFVIVKEDNKEIAISYWEDEEEILRWKNNAEHLIAQETGKQKWYESYKVEVVKVLREYGKNTI